MAVAATKAVRDLAAERLRTAYDPKIVDSFVTGRSDGVVDPSRRIRFVPLPSIGARYTESSIRRVSVELPPDCPVAADDIRWAISGQQVPELGSVRLIEAVENPMAYPYRIGRGARRWQTVTPVALPTQRIAGRNGALARLDTERAAVFDVIQALRHAGVRSRVTDIRVQREPFSIRGIRAEEFEADRFDARRLYHVDITFDQDVSGLLSIGDGRWLGLGLMRAFAVDDDEAPSDLISDSANDEEAAENDDDGNGDGE
jgi:CRISPR-associated protein Csb2